MFFFALTLPKAFLCKPDSQFKIVYACFFFKLVVNVCVARQKEEDKARNKNTGEPS
jgi:hypothetical protein